MFISVQQLKAASPDGQSSGGFVFLFLHPCCWRKRLVLHEPSRLSLQESEWHWVLDISDHITPHSLLTGLPLTEKHLCGVSVCASTCALMILNTPTKQGYVNILCQTLQLHLPPAVFPRKKMNWPLQFPVDSGLGLRSSFYIHYLPEPDRMCFLRLNFAAKENMSFHHLLIFTTVKLANSPLRSRVSQ